jgi:hypothetical protein
VGWGRQRNRAFFSGMLRGVSNACKGSKILTFLYRSRLVCTARSFIPEARGREILGSSAIRVVPVPVQPDGAGVQSGW